MASPCATWECSQLVALWVKAASDNRFRSKSVKPVSLCTTCLMHAPPEQQHCAQRSWQSKQANATWVSQLALRSWQVSDFLAAAVLQRASQRNGHHQVALVQSPTQTDSSVPQLCQAPLHKSEWNTVTNTVVLRSSCSQRFLKRTMHTQP